MTVPDCMNLLERKTSFEIGNCFKWFIIFILTFIIIYYSIAQLSKASLYGIFNIFTVNFSNDDSSENIHEYSMNHLLLPTFSQIESQLLNTKLKLFFVQTSENDDIISRHGCSIESAVRLHPNGLIFVLMYSKYIHLKKGSFKYLRSYKNLYFVHFNEQDIYFNTKLMKLNQTTRKEFIHYFTISHMSDLIRTALLYKYGGIYFDLDVIPLKNFNQFLNTVALETDDTVNVAVLIFEKRQSILDLQMNIQLKSIENHFNSLCWNCLGPLALTSALKEICDQQKLYIHNKDKCQQIDIQPSFVFYPIAYQEIPKFFRRSSENVNHLLKNSSIYSIHYFHHMTMNIPIEIMSPFAQIANIYCPNVSQELIDVNISNYPSKFFFININIFFICLFLTFICIFIFLLFTQLISYIQTMRIILPIRRQKIHL